ncbi:MAG TPA: hypothetical protein VGL22_04290 [Terracidiphilus sp.]
MAETIVPMAFALLGFFCFMRVEGQAPGSIRNAAGVRLMVAADDADPTLRITVPGYSGDEAAFLILLPEHVTVRARGKSDATHIYLWQPGNSGAALAWSATSDSLQYEKDLEDGILIIARATLEADGVLFHYEFRNRSAVDYDMVYAPTDPRLTGVFHDARLERTYVHHAGGFELLASETPQRMTMPLNEWLPARYMASYTWAVPAKLVDKRADGITYYNKSRVVDEPMIATLSSDGKWVVASFTRTVGNVWSNPELTCQHVDPTAALPAHGMAVIELKMLILRRGLKDALRKVIQQRESLH